MTFVGKHAAHRWIGLILVLDVVVIGIALAATFLRPRPKPAVEAPVVLLVSLDGFRADYVDRFEPPVLLGIAAEGIRARSMTPSFPTKTFPNHYTIVTGMYPARHGVIGNTMQDPEIDDRFSLGNREAVRDGRWWGGEPIWVTVRHHGLRSAPFFWPGAEASIAGTRPDYWVPYDGTMPARERISMVMDCLRLPERPAFLSMYLNDVDDHAHEFGPFSDSARVAVHRVDGYLQALDDSLSASGLLDEVNLIIVSDHGMADTSRERVVILDDYIDMTDVEDHYGGPNVMIWPKEGRLDDLAGALRDVPHAEFHRREEIPERYLFGGHRRIAPLVGIADEGWTITTRYWFERNPAHYDGGSHGYSQDAPSMQALFLARGPAFRRGAVVEPFSNVEVYNVMAAVLGVEAADNDGSLDSMRHLLRDDWPRERRTREALPANDDDAPRTCASRPLLR